MKLIEQLKEDMKAYMNKIGDIEAQAKAENRPINDAEKEIYDALLNKVEECRSEVELRERKERLTASLEAPEKPATVAKGKIEVGDDRRTKERFGTSGEFMMAVKQACTPGHHGIDPRLFKAAAATGLNETTPSEGGFLLQQSFAQPIFDDIFSTGILSSRCRNQPITVGNSIKIPGYDETSRASSLFGGVTYYWTKEAGEKQASMPKYSSIELVLKKVICLIPATDELLEDAPGLGSFLDSSARSALKFATDDAIINGIGGGQPLGFLNAGCLVSVAKETGQPAATIVAENIIKMYSRMFASSMGNAVWLVNQNTLPQLFTLGLSVGTGGAPIFMPAGGLSQSPYNTILGRPVIPIEQAAALGTVGDITFADLQGYVLAQKGDIRADMSIHVYFLYDQSVFRFVLRIDGQPARKTVLTPFKGGVNDTQSHFVALATRA